MPDYTIQFSVRNFLPGRKKLREKNCCIKMFGYYKKDESVQDSGINLFIDKAIAKSCRINSQLINCSITVVGKSVKRGEYGGSI